MSDNSYLISSDLLKNFITNGFSNLQQNEEFVDMTIAAEGHLVKVHKNLMALASPYIKEMLKSASCSHPVLFLSNISHTTLCYLLEYIYTGEVHIPKDMITTFIETSKMLCIKGIESIVMANNQNQVCPFDDTDNVEQEAESNIHEEGINTDLTRDYAAHITINSSNCQVNVQKFCKQDQQTEQDYLANNEQEIVEYTLSEPELNDVFNTVKSTQLQKTNSYEIDPGDTMEKISINFTTNEIKQSQGFMSDTVPNSLATALSPQYSVSNKGAIQLILNRYLYYCHHQSNKNRKRRWRCVDYRRNHCPAYIDTYEEKIVSRRGSHNHGFHDRKIMKKTMSGRVYTSVVDIKESSCEKGLHSLMEES